MRDGITAPLPNSADPSFAFFGLPTAVPLATDASASRRVNFAVVLSTTISNVPYTFYDGAAIENCYVSFENLVNASGAAQSPYFVQFYPFARTCASVPLKGAIEGFSGSISALENVTAPEDFAIKVAAAGALCSIFLSHHFLGGICELTRNC
jgi:hypothetical protein